MKNLLAAVIALALLCVGATVPQAKAQDAPAKPPVKTKAARPSQASVALKNKSFAKAEPGKVAKAIPATNLDAAKKLVGKRGAFVGTVARVFAPGSHSVVLLNFAGDYKSALIGVVDAQDFAKFPDLQTLVGKKVVLAGMVEDFKGQPEVRLNSLDDIQIAP